MCAPGHANSTWRMNLQSRHGHAFRCTRTLLRRFKIPAQEGTSGLEEIASLRREIIGYNQRNLSPGRQIVIKNFMI